MHEQTPAAAGLGAKDGGRVHYAPAPDAAGLRKIYRLQGSKLILFRHHGGWTRGATKGESCASPLWKPHG